VNKISVIIPTFQHASTLPACIDSVLGQSRKPDEIIVVDDGSTDSTSGAISKYTKDVTYIKQENQGAPVARNNGFERSSGDLVIFWDADIIGAPDMLQELEDALANNPEASWVYSRFKWGSRSFGNQAFSAEDLKTHNYIHTTSLIRRRDFPQFDPSLKRFQDWDLWLTMSEQGKLGVFVDKELFKILIEKNRDAYSTWLPSILYKIPWHKFWWTPRSIKKHNEAKEIITKKHNL
jgi:glycosyltransferase involved in cell wall biosynthesis